MKIGTYTQRQLGNYQIKITRKRHNRTYKKSLTKYQTEKLRKQNLGIVIAIFASITIGMLIELAATTNSMEINGGEVSEQSVASPTVEQVVMAETSISAPLPVMIGNNEIENYIIKEAKAHGINPQRAIDIARCESNFNPKAKNKNSTASGLWQYTAGTFIDGIRWRGLDWDLEDRFDYKKSTDMTMWFVKKEGWGRWACDLIIKTKQNE